MTHSLRESGLDGGEIDPIFGKMVPSFDGLKTVIAPKMRKAGGSYRANQVRLLGADTPAAVYDLVKQRRDECFSCLSPGYMASRLYFVKQWIWFCLEVAEVNPIRKWTGGCDDFEDGLIEAFVLTCSCRFVTWGSINQARMHVVEFLRWTTGVVPPELPKTTYTMKGANSGQGSPSAKSRRCSTSHGRPWTKRTTGCRRLS